MTDSAVTKRRDSARTKERILAAAQEAFANVGYSAAGIRDIARIAGVDSALVQRYFGSKAGLFQAALVDAAVRYDDMDLTHQGFGARLTQRYLESELDLRALSMVAFSTNDPESRDISVWFMEEYALKPLADWLGEPNARTRAVRITMLSTSFMLYTRQIPLMSPGATRDNETAEWLASSLQSIIDENRS